MHVSSLRLMGIRITTGFSLTLFFTIVANPCMGGRLHVYVCLYVRGGLQSRQRRDGEEREKGDFDESVDSCWPAAGSV